MMLIEHEVNRILKQSETSATTLRQLYLLNRRRRRAFSLGYICRHSGIPSKGYLAFVMKGERVLSPRYWNKICEVFKLTEEQADFLNLQLLRETLPEENRALNNALSDFREQIAVG